MKRSSTGAKLAAVLLGASLVAAACGSSSKTATSSTSAAGGATTAASTATTAGAATTAGPATTAATATTAAPAPAGAAGGTLVVGAEQEPDCTDFINSCGGSSWGAWMTMFTTLPQAFTVVKEGDTYSPKASNVLAGEPTLVSSPKQVVTYKINPKAVWSKIGRAHV